MTSYSSMLNKNNVMKQSSILKLIDEITMDPNTRPADHDLYMTIKHMITEHVYTKMRERSLVSAPSEAAAAASRKT